MDNLTDDQIREFNLFRVNMLNKKLSIIEMGKELKRKTTFPGSIRFVAHLSEGPNPPIIRNEDATYSVNDKPVHKERLQLCIDSYESAIASNARKQNKTSKYSMTVDGAISLLKSKGYKIYKPTVEYKEV